jgi:hypothetical protein
MRQSILRLNEQKAKQAAISQSNPETSACGAGGFMKNLFPFTRKAFFCLLFFFVFYGLDRPTAEAFVVEAGDRTYLVDRTGERWDITQARSIGFDPQHFEFGIGRNAFRPLDERDWRSDTANSRPSMRIIGITGGDASQSSIRITPSARNRKTLWRRSPRSLKALDRGNGH